MISVGSGHLTIAVGLAVGLVWYARRQSAISLLVLSKKEKALLVDFANYLQREIKLV